MNMGRICPGYSQDMATPIYLPGILELAYVTITIIQPLLKQLTYNSREQTA
jgi:hypothetical protein